MGNFGTSGVAGEQNENRCHQIQIKDLVLF